MDNFHIVSIELMLLFTAGETVIIICIYAHSFSLKMGICQIRISNASSSWWMNGIMSEESESSERSELGASGTKLEKTN